jgi:hypothetical protein
VTFPGHLGLRGPVSWGRFLWNLITISWAWTRN